MRMLNQITEATDRTLINLHHILGQMSLNLICEYIKIVQNARKTSKISD